MTTKKFKMTYMAYVIFLLDSAVFSLVKKDRGKKETLANCIVNKEVMIYIFFSWNALLLQC